jgi:NADH:ubiquinone oxidoreductase subunit F (NADH-binding)
MIKRCCICKDIIDDMGFSHKKYCGVCGVARTYINNIISQANRKAPKEIKCLDCNTMVKNIKNTTVCKFHRIKRRQIRQIKGNYKRKLRNIFKVHSNIGIYLDPNN